MEERKGPSGVAIILWYKVSQGSQSMINNISLGSTIDPIKKGGDSYGFPRSRFKHIDSSLS